MRREILAADISICGDERSNNVISGINKGRPVSRWSQANARRPVLMQHRQRWVCSFVILVEKFLKIERTAQTEEQLEKFVAIPA